MRRERIFTLGVDFLAINYLTSTTIPNEATHQQNVFILSLYFSIILDCVCTVRFRELAWIIRRQFSSHVIHIWSIPRLNYPPICLSVCACVSVLWVDAIHLIHKYWLLSHITFYIYDVLLGVSACKNALNQSDGHINYLIHTYLQLMWCFHSNQGDDWG